MKTLKSYDSNAHTQTETHRQYENITFPHTRVVKMFESTTRTTHNRLHYVFSFSHVLYLVLMLEQHGLLR